MTRKKFANGLITTFGIFSIAFGLLAWWSCRAEADLSTAAARILLGEVFNPNQLKALKLQIDTELPRRLSPLELNSLAVIRLRLAETAPGSIESWPATNERHSDFETSLVSALSIDPTNSFLWLADYWIQDPGARGSAGSLRLLEMSYLSGPNEAWIAVRRNPLAMGVFSSLPNNLSEKVATEFVGLIRSALYLDAFNALDGAQDAVRQEMLARLVQVDEANRREFTKLLRSKNPSWFGPGKVEPAARPF